MVHYELRLELRTSVFVPTHKTLGIDLKGGLEKGESGRTNQILGVPPALQGLVGYGLQMILAA